MTATSGGGRHVDRHRCRRYLYGWGAFFGRDGLHSVKHLTDESDLQGTLLSVLDELLAHGKAKSIKRVVLSTTLVTNLLATGQGERTALLLLPGSGLPFSSYQISPDTYFLKGSIDFRGRRDRSTGQKGDRRGPGRDRPGGHSEGGRCGEVFQSQRPA